MAQHIETVPGSQLTYIDQATFGAITSRKEVIITPKYGGTFRAGNILRIEIPAQDYIDPDTIYMSFKSELFAGLGNNFQTSTIGTVLTEASGIPYLGVERLHSSNVNCMKTLRFQPGIQCIFNRIKVLAGSTTIEDIQDYDDLYRFMLEATTSPQWRKTDGGEQEGFYDPEDIAQTITASNHHSEHNTVIDYTKTTYNGVGHYYTVRPMLGLLAIGKLLPVKYMGNITLEFYLAENKDCLWSTSTAAVIAAKTYKVPIAETNTANVGFTHLTFAQTIQTAIMPHPGMATGNSLGTLACAIAPVTNPVYAAGHVITAFPNGYYQISDVELHVQFCTVLQDFDQALMSKIENDGLDLHFSTFHEHVRQITSASKQTLTFSERSLSVKGGFVLMRNSDDLRDIRSDVSYVANNIAEYQWKIGNEYIPAQPVETATGGARALVQLKMALGTFNTMGKSNNIKEWDYLRKHPAGTNNTQDFHELQRCGSQPSKFAIGLNLEKSPGQMSGFDSAAAGVDIELQLTLATQRSKFVSSYAAGNAFSGEFDTSTWQPSKYKVYAAATPDSVFATTITNGFAVGEDYGPGGYSSVLRCRAAGVAPTDEPGGFCDKFYANPGGLMLPKNSVAAFLHVSAAFTLAGYLLSSGVTWGAPDNTGKYSRLQFFAHVDSLLRIRRVGQLEVVV